MSTDVYADKPWLGVYPENLPADITVEYDDMLSLFKASVERNPDGVIIKYFDGEITLAELDAKTDALAVSLVERGFQPGDRLAVYLQNVPQFLIGMVATWKAGGIMVSINPMNRERELDYLLKDSGARALICHEQLYADVAASVVPDTDVSIVLTTSELAYQTRNDPRIFGKVKRMRSEGVDDLEEVIEANLGKKPTPVSFSANDTAILTYTSGTTGVPKGAMNTHLNMTFTAQAYRDWIGLTADDSIFAVAPLFHITGLIGHIATSLLLGVPCVLTYRFDPNVAAETIQEHGCTFTIGSITVFIAMMNTSTVTPQQLSTLKKIYSGGAAIPPQVVADFKEKLGHYIHGAYGLTETTSPSHFGPLGVDAPADPTSGALSVGVPIFGTVVRIIDEEGNPLPLGEVGQIQTEGPQVVPGYWRKEKETAESLPGGRLNTGDVGFADENGWFYIVDRIKDMINASGYKVWPREVEDVLYTHPAVLEAAVVGVPDEYRGESVKAYVSVKAGQTLTPEEVVAFTKERMAAYKYPRQVEIVDELPKTVTGKILRRELRALNT